MGADLFLDKIFKAREAKYEPLFLKWVKVRDEAVSDEERKAAQKKVMEYYAKIHDTGYFRDSYNNSSLLWLFDLSWWDDITPRLKNSLLGKKDILWLLNELKKRETVFYSNLAKYSEFDAKTERKKDVDKYFISKYESLKSFLNMAIKENTAISCSL